MKLRRCVSSTFYHDMAIRRSPWTRTPGCGRPQVRGRNLETEPATSRYVPRTCLDSRAPSDTSSVRRCPVPRRTPLGARTFRRSTLVHRAASVACGAASSLDSRQVRLSWTRTRREEPWLARPPPPARTSHPASTCLDLGFWIWLRPRPRIPPSTKPSRIVSTGSTRRVSVARRGPGPCEPVYVQVSIRANPCGRSRGHDDAPAA